MIGILSDAHGNAGAARVAFMQLRRMGVESYIYLGDALGYIPSLGVLEMLHAMGNEVECVKGNHEEMVIRNRVAPGLDPVYQHQFIRKTIRDEQMQYISGWPCRLEKVIRGKEILFVHGSPEDPLNGYLYPDSDLERLNRTERFVFSGHSHYPFIKTVGPTTFVNVGSCGLPRDDGRYGAFATFDLKTLQAVIYRYRIDGTMGELPEDVRGGIHSSVHDVFMRRSAAVQGVILTERDMT